MAYSTKADVKKRLEGSSFDTTDDEAIDHFIEQADAYINGLLDAKNIATPVSPVPTILKHASADLAAQLFRSREAPPGEKRTYFEQAREQVDIYVASQGKAGTVKLTEISEDRSL